MFTPEERAARDLRRGEELMVCAALEARLANEHGLTDHPKRFRLWEIAFDHGHASGLGEVEMFYNEFAELMKP